MRKKFVCLKVFITTFYVCSTILFIIQGNKIKKLEEYTKALQYYTEASIYKKDAQLYIMNAAYGDEKMHKALADSCKADCLTHKNRMKKNE